MTVQDFQRAGFDKERLFYTQGDFGLFQCSKPCCNETFDNEKVIKEMIAKQKNMKIPNELIPRCPHCNLPVCCIIRLSGSALYCLINGDINNALESLILNT